MKKPKKMLVLCSIEVDDENWEYDKEGIGIATGLITDFKGRITEEELELLKGIIKKFLYYKKV